MWRGRRRAQREPYTYVHHGTVVEGDVVADGRLRVHGAVRGDVRAAGLLEVAAEGRVTAARIEAQEVRILGDVRGDVHARGSVQIWRGGSLVGDVHAATLDIEEGASFTGRSHMHADESDPGAGSAERDEGADAVLEGERNGA